MAKYSIILQDCVLSYKTF